MNNEDNIPRDNDSIPSDRTSDAGSGLFSFEVINNIDDVDQLPAADPLDLAQDPQVPAVIADPQLAAPPVANPQVVAIGGQAAAVQANPLPAVPPVVNPQAQVVQFAGVPQVPGVQPHVGGPAPNVAAQPGNVPPPPQVAGNHPPTPIHHGPSPIITMNIGNTNPSTSSGAQLVTPTNIASDKGISPWQRTYTTPTVIHPTKTAANGRKLELTWCPKCGPGRTAGNPSGLYMEPFNGKPHNHDEWLEAKIAKSRNRFNVNKRKVSGDVVKKSDIVTATIDKSFTPHNSAKKQRLKIRENLIKSLTTNVSLSVDEAEKIADESGAVASPAHLKE
jgi:hypothetical protein